MTDEYVRCVLSTGQLVDGRTSFIDQGNRDAKCMRATKENSNSRPLTTKEIDLYVKW